MNTNSLFNNIANAEQIVVYNKASKIVLNRGEDKFEMMLNAFLNTIKGAREMPAFGVSIDEDTRKAMKSGTWIEFCFNNTRSHNEMPFDALLVHIDANDLGINLIRKQNGKYDGRCFYLDLNTNLKALLQIITLFNAQ